MEILKIFIYLITGGWTVYYVAASIYVTWKSKVYDPAFAGIAITVILWAASIAFYIGG